MMSYYNNYALSNGFNVGVAGLMLQLVVGGRAVSYCDRYVLVVGQHFVPMDAASSFEFFVGGCFWGSRYHS